MPTIGLFLKAPQGSCNVLAMPGERPVPVIEMLEASFIDFSDVLGPGYLFKGAPKKLQFRPTRFKLYVHGIEQPLVVYRRDDHEVAGSGGSGLRNNPDPSAA